MTNRTVIGVFAVMMAWTGLCPARADAQAPVPVVEYYHMDAVGSVRAVTNQSGAVVRRHDYFPFGEGDGVAAGSDPLRFTGKERDAETGLDYFGARYYAQRSGRFTTVDPQLSVAAALVDPQRWNRYAYAKNSPLVMIDPDGRDAITALIRLMDVLRYNAPRALSIPQMVETVATPMLEAAFGPNVFSDGGGLFPHEAAFLREVGAYKGMHTMGVADQKEPGIDAIAFSGGLLKSITPLELKVTGSLSLQAPLDIAAAAARQVTNAGYAGMGVELYIKATGITAAGVAEFAQGGSQGLLNISKSGAFKSITIFTRDGVVTITNGTVTTTQVKK